MSDFLIPGVTVCIPSIPGREKLRRRAVNSVIDQTEPATWLMLEIDAERTGAAATRNRMLDKVATQWIAWLDDDDELLPHHVSALHRAAMETGADLVYPTPILAGGRDPTATSLNGAWVLPWGVPFGPEQEQHLRQHGNFIPMTHLVRTEVARRARFPIPGTPEWPRPNVEDWGYLIRLLDVGARFVHLDRQTWIWHIHDAHTGGEPTR